MGQIDLLYRLQQLDNDLSRGKRRLLEVLQAQKETAELLAARETASAAEQTVQQLRLQQKDQELEMGSLTAKLDKGEQRLYSGQIKTTKELADLQKAIAAMKRQHERLEEQLLETMMSFEEAEASHTQATQTLQGLEATWETLQVELKQEQYELATRINQLNARREQEVGQIDPSLLSEYNRLRQKKNGVAVALYQQERCQGCQVSASASKVQRLREGGVESCSSCGRLLYMGW